MESVRLLVIINKFEIEQLEAALLPLLQSILSRTELSVNTSQSIAVDDAVGVCRRTADVRSVGYSELFVLSREDVLAAFKDHPEAEVHHHHHPHHHHHHFIYQRTKCIIEIQIQITRKS